MSEQGYEQLTFFQADSPASRFPWLESKRANQTSVTFGLKCSELSDPLRRISSSVRTYLESCELQPGRWSRIWSAKAMTSSCLILKLRLSERRITGEGSVSSDAKAGPDRWRANKETLDGQPRMWKTPIASDAANRQFYHNSRGEPNLSGMVQMWPTPHAEDYKGSGLAFSKSAEHDRIHRNLKGCVMYPTPRAQSATGASEAPNRQGAPDLQTVCGGLLNPTWVEWLMGFPIGWTELSVSETR